LCDHSPNFSGARPVYLSQITARRDLADQSVLVQDVSGNGAYQIGIGIKALILISGGLRLRVSKESSIVSIGLWRTMRAQEG